MKAGEKFIYTGTVRDRFTVILLDPNADEDEMVKVQRLRDGMVTWVHTWNLKETRD